jgi:single-strand DNA-binding protein
LTEWHTKVLGKNLASLVERFFKKGDWLYLEGKVSTRNYESSTGKKKYITEIVEPTSQMLNPKLGESSREPVPEPEYHKTDNPYVPQEGYLPF